MLTMALVLAGISMPLLSMTCDVDKQAEDSSGPSGCTQRVSSTPAGKMVISHVNACKGKEKIKKGKLLTETRNEWKKNKNLRD